MCVTGQRRVTEADVRRAEHVGSVAGLHTVNDATKINPADRGGWVARDRPDGIAGRCAGVDCASPRKAWLAPWTPRSPHFIGTWGSASGKTS